LQRTGTIRVPGRREVEVAPLPPYVGVVDKMLANSDLVPMPVRPARANDARVGASLAQSRPVGPPRGRDRPPSRP
jgi:hypothetical protein